MTCELRASCPAPSSAHLGPPGAVHQQVGRLEVPARRTGWGGWGVGWGVGWGGGGGVGWGPGPRPGGGSTQSAQQQAQQAQRHASHAWLPDQARPGPAKASVCGPVNDGRVVRVKCQHAFCSVQRQPQPARPCQAGGRRLVHVGGAQDIKKRAAGAVLCGRQGRGSMHEPSQPVPARRTVAAAGPEVGSQLPAQRGAADLKRWPVAHRRCPGTAPGRKKGLGNKRKDSWHACAAPGQCLRL